MGNYGFKTSKPLLCHSLVYIHIFMLVTMVDLWNLHHPPWWLPDLFWLLCLQRIAEGSVTVWAVMFTVVICCFGIVHNQKLLDVPLQKTEKQKK